jgi:transcriptional regulator
MYIPPIYKNGNLDDVRDFVEKNSFGLLISQTDGRPWATHIPLELSINEAGKEVLTGHISKANPQWKNFTDGSTLLAVFSGANSYISSSWYDHENVPTWNYIAVHIYGTVKVLASEALLQSLEKLVDKYEKASEKPVSVEAMSEKFIQREMRGIVGFELEIQEIQAAYKLSQNRDDFNHANIVEALKKTRNEAAIEIAQEMEKERHLEKGCWPTNGICDARREGNPENKQ